MQRIAPVIVALIFFGSGLAHGLLTDRWTSPVDLEDAVARFDRLAMNLGDWEGQPIDQKNTPNTGLAGLVSRRYVHKRTGKEATILLGVGRAGGVSTHTPEVCYAAFGYEMESKSEYVMPDKSARPGAVFFRGQFAKTRAAEQSRLRIFWSWYADGKWQVADNPRIAFAGQPVLHKLYVQREISNPNETLDGDGCLELLEALLPHLERDVLPKSSTIASLRGMPTGVHPWISLQRGDDPC